MEKKVRIAIKWIGSSITLLLVCVQSFVTQYSAQREDRQEQREKERKNQGMRRGFMTSSWVYQLEARECKLSSSSSAAAALMEKTNTTV